MRILGLLILFLCLSQSAKASNTCIQCHDTHYTDTATCVLCHQGNDTSTRKNVAHDTLIEGPFAYHLLNQSKPVINGRQLMENSKCRRCHQSGLTGNTLTSNLNNTSRHLSSKEIVTAILKPNNFMPNFHFSKKQAVWLVNTIYANAHDTISSDTLQIVHFQPKRTNTFTEKCGNCHKVLSSQFGPLGKGNIGPNLSGLFTPYGFQAESGKRWDELLLKKWLKNPRELRPNSSMPVIILKENEFKSLVNELK